MTEPNDTRQEDAAMGARPIGELLVASGKLAQADVRRVVFAQRQKSISFGQAAIEMGLITQTDVQSALSRQFDYPYVESSDSPLDRRLVAAFQPFGVQAEALRVLRTQLMLRWFGERSRVLAIVSPRAEEESSLLVANLAIVFAQLGERTLLVDANCRNPVQHSLFGLKSGTGLSAILGGRSSHKDAPLPIQGFDNLSVLCAGTAAPNPQELLGRVSFAYLMETLPAAYDVVLVDTPPVLDYADAQVIAARAGGWLLVTRRHRTHARDVRQVKERLEPTGAVPLGAVICD